MILKFLLFFDASVFRAKVSHPQIFTDLKKWPIEFDFHADLIYPELNLTESGNKMMLL